MITEMASAGNGICLLPQTIAMKIFHIQRQYTFISWNGDNFSNLLENKNNLWKEFIVIRLSVGLMPIFVTDARYEMHIALEREEGAKLHHIFMSQIDATEWYTKEFRLQAYPA